MSRITEHSRQRQGHVEIARRFVLRTNTWPGLRGLYHAGYELGLSFTTNRLSSLPDVLAVLLRVGEDGRAWVPGLSDYDLTVLTDRCDAARMTRVLEEIWGRYRRIKRVVPQVGETEIMNVEEYADFLSFGPLPTAALKLADPRFVRPGRPDLETVLRRRPHVARERELLLDALSRYIRFLFPSWLHCASDGSHMARCRAEHLLSNVVKRLWHLERPAETMQPNEAFAARVLQVFTDLSRICSAIVLGADDGASIAGPDTAKGADGAIALIESFVSEALRESKVRDCAVILWNTYMSADKLNLAFVIPDDTPGNELSKLVARLGALRRNSEGLWKSQFTNGELQQYFPALPFPVVLSRSMWKCWRELSPFDGVAVAATGRTLMGPEDTLRGIPSTAALKRGAEVQYAALLPLKNNWRPLPGSGTPRLYAAMMNYVKGYTSAASGRVLTSPTTHDFKSTPDGYQAVCEELKVLRASLTA